MHAARSRRSPSRSGPVVAGKALRGGPSGGRCGLVLAAVLIAAAATVGFGIAPSPLVDFAENAGASIAEMVSQIGDSVWEPMQHVLVEQDFSKPPERVFAFLAEHENLEQLFGAKITRLKDGDDGQRNGVGSVRQLKVGPLPPFEETIIEFVPDELIRYMITKGSPLRHHHGEMLLTPADSGEGTHLRYEIAFDRPVVPGHWRDRRSAAGATRAGRRHGPT